MTELNPDLIERAAKALWDEPGWDRASHEQRQHHREAAERALSAVLPGIIQQAKAEALARLGRAAYAVDSTHHFHDIQCSCGFTGDARKRTQTEHITTAVLEAYDHD